MSIQSLKRQVQDVQGHTDAGSTTFLRGVLLGNSAFSLLTGLICLLDAALLATWTGLQPPLIFTVLGVVLLAFGIEVGWIALRMKEIRLPARIIFALDGAWVAASILVLVGGWLPFTTAGVWIVVIVADVVAVFAVLEYMGLRRASVSQ